MVGLSHQHRRSVAGDSMSGEEALGGTQRLHQPAAAGWTPQGDSLERNLV